MERGEGIEKAAPLQRSDVGDGLVWDEGLCLGEVIREQLVHEISGDALDVIVEAVDILDEEISG
jgi:hypothetical protein